MVMPWYALRTKPGREDEVSSCLAREGLDVFLPRIQVRRRRRGMIRLQIEPLFPAYLFLFVEDLGPKVWNIVRWTRGVKTILGCEGVPSSVPDDAIMLIRQRIGAGGVIQVKPAFAPGNRLRITAGPFADLVGIMEGDASRAGRVRVLLSILSGARVELEDVDLELVG